MDISIDKVCEIIAYLRAVEAKEEVVDPDSGSNAIDDGARDILQDERDDATAGQVRGVINGLDDDEAADLVALMWIGRGDYEAAEWPIARAAARERRETATARYILGTPNAADLINEGLAAHGMSCAEAD
ncbi:DUF3775 domain-containing protein [Terrarubrum flagellatum]|uniref:DUF3775 domain-containing protein n=1 Tax=Terrirubrum flagellatum TaxID=2895980 RepID=UPI0031453EB4